MTRKECECQSGYVNIQKYVEGKKVIGRSKKRWINRIENNTKIADLNKREVGDS